MPTGADAARARAMPKFCLAFDALMLSINQILDKTFILSDHPPSTAEILLAASSKCGSIVSCITLALVRLA